ncbi:phage integrase N-terminal domain-containing protein [Coxiella burnetii]
MNIIDHNRDDSYRTQNDRQKYLISMAENLYAAGFQLEHAHFLKSKHI